MNSFKAGTWNAICDRCGFKYKSDELKKDWQGLMVCAADFELRNAQDLIKVRPETAIPDWTRTRPVDAFLLYTLLNDTLTAVSGEGDDNNQQDYVDPTYLLEDYIFAEFLIVAQFNRAFTEGLSTLDAPVLVATKPLTDVVATSDALLASFVATRIVNDTVVTASNGFTSIANYVEFGYMPEDYVQDIVLF